ncbi:MAG TPA: DUF5916 domain-containing protein [Longimicrobiaceae bacterium]|nr:DUF5916 domain-containing protein [Longimicrobiaceae bacterium]
MLTRSLSRCAALVVLCAAAATPLAAQNNSSDHTRNPTARAVERTGPILLDGRLDEPVWATASPATGFTQHNPDEGRPAQRTEVRFAYDAEALYIGARMFDSLGAAGVRSSLVRRDQNVESDWLQLIFDTYHDHAGRTIFQVNPSGVKYDAGQASPSADPSWDPIWEAATHIDSVGWTAELRIPFSQLRFSRDADQTWGLQIWRYAQRRDEISMWSFWGRQEAGGPARFGHLEGIRITERPRGLEIMPYAVARASYVEPSQPGSPFQDGNAFDGRVGADVRALLGSNLTLSATVNPDFGQVEQDPAVVNLTAFESFFEEKRPFFVEGSGLLSFGGLNCFSCSNVSGMSLFYSRRIGRSPQGGVPNGYEYIETPRNARLLGAAKLTGRTRDGWQLGALEAVTAREVARVQDGDGVRGEYPVEPFTNYLLGRVRRITRGGSRTWGLMATSVVRRFGDGDGVLRDQLPSHAEALGADWNLYWKNQTYRLMGNFAVSSVGGDSLAIRRLQFSSARYFQRPDRVSGGNGLFSDELDPRATVLRGFGGYLRASKESGGWRWEAQTNYRSPGFEVNDMAFLTRADYVWMGGNLVRSITRPGSWYRDIWLSVGGQQQYNFDGDRTDLQVHAYGGATFHNLWNAGMYMHYRPEVDDDRATRGGAVVRRAASWFMEPQLSTDARKRVVLSFSPGFAWRADGGSSIEANGTLRVKPATNVQLSFSPVYSYNHTPAQYLRRFNDPSATGFYGHRVMFADLEQRTVSLDTRLNWTFSPTLTLELFAQPFIATGEYTDFNEYARPRTLERRVFGPDQLRVSRATEGGRPLEYTLDPDRNPATTNFTFGNPDFNVRSLRGNAVLRWEYRPGSVLYFVWQQERSGSEGFGDFSFDRDASAIFRQHPDNVFVIKASYWLGR